MSIACRWRNRREIASAFSRISNSPSPPAKTDTGFLRRLIERRCGILRRNPAQVARLRLVDRATAMQRAAIVPDPEVAGPPVVTIDELGPGRVLDQLAQ